MWSRVTIIGITMSGALLVLGCEQKNPPVAAKGPTMHEHHAPHKGTLVELGEEFAHLELVLDPATGKLTGYLLDGEAENPVRTNNQMITIRVTRVTGSATTRPAPFSVDLKPVANALSGETVGNTSQFEGQSADLIGVTNFDGQVAAVTARAKDFKDVDFNYPAGNEAKGQ